MKTLNCFLYRTSRIAATLAMGAVALTSTANAAPIPVPDEMGVFSVTNYKIQASQNLFICQQGIVCNADQRSFSDILTLRAAPAGNATTVLFFSDAESQINSTPPAGAVFGVETGNPLDFTFPAFDPNNVLRNITFRVFSDLDTGTAPPVKDSLEVLALAGGPAPDLALVPEPSTLLLIALGLGLLGRLGKRRWQKRT